MDSKSETPVTVQAENRQSFLNRLVTQELDKLSIDEIMFVYDIAKSAHRGQLRKDKQTRYFEHLRRTALILMDELKDYVVYHIITMLLHDTVEDTAMFGNLMQDDFEIVSKIASYRIAKIASDLPVYNILALTKNPKASLEEYWRKIGKDPELVIFKMVDRLDNLRDCRSLSEDKKSFTSFVHDYVKETKEQLLPLCETYLANKECHGIKKITYLYEAISEAINSLEGVFAANSPIWVVKWSATDFDWENEQGENMYKDPVKAYQAYERMKKKGYGDLVTQVSSPKLVYVTKDIFDKLEE